MSEESPLITAAALPAHVGRQVRLIGIYQAEFDPAHKMLTRDADGTVAAATCVVLLALEDGGFVDLFDRPLDEGRKLDGTRVMVTAEVSAPCPEEDDTIAAADPMYELIRVSRIAPTD